MDQEQYTQSGGEQNIHGKDLTIRPPSDGIGSRPGVGHIPSKKTSDSTRIPGGVGPVELPA